MIHLRQFWVDITMRQWQYCTASCFWHSAFLYSSMFFFFFLPVCTSGRSGSCACTYCTPGLPSLACSWWFGLAVQMHLSEWGKQKKKDKIVLNQHCDAKGMTVKNYPCLVSSHGKLLMWCNCAVKLQFTCLLPASYLKANFSLSSSSDCSSRSFKRSREYAEFVIWQD